MTSERATTCLRLAAICAVAVALAAIAGAAPAADFRLEARYGFENVARPECWSAVTVDVANDGPERIGLLTVAPAPGSVVRSGQPRGCFVRIPRGSRQRYSLLWKGGYWGGMGSLAVSIGRVAARPPNVTYLDDSETLLVAAGFPPGALGYLAQVPRTRLTMQTFHTPATAPGPGGGGQGHIVPVHIPADRLPENPLVYNQVDLLVLGPVFASDLTPGARAAIAAWVRGGGNLAIIGGADVARLRDPFFQDLLPVEGLTSAAVPIPSGLSAYGISVPEPTAVAVGVRRRDANVIAQERGVPLIVRGRLGSGAVTFIAFDPTRPPVAGAGRLEKLWLPLFDDLARLYSLREDTGGSRPGSGGPRGLQQVLRGHVVGIKQMTVPPLTTILLFLGLYFVLLIPVNHWLLSRRKRRELAWVTTPVIAAVFVAGAYAVGYNIKGPRLLVKQATVMELGEGSRQASVLSYFGVFSPARRAYDIKVGLRDGAIGEGADWPYGPGSREVTSGLVHDEPDPWVEGELVPMWGMASHTAAGVMDTGGPVTADLRLLRAGVAGWVRNDTRWKLINIQLWGSGVGLNLGDLAPGARLDIRPAAGQVAAGGTQLEPWRMEVAGSLLQPRRVVSELALLAEVKPSPISVEVGRACDRDARTILFVRILLQGGGRYVRMLAQDFTVTWDRPNMPLTRADPQAVATCAPAAYPPGLRAQAISLEFSHFAPPPAHGGPVGPACDILMYDWSAASWRAVGSLPSTLGRGWRAGPGGGFSSTVMVPNASRFVADTGVINVKAVVRRDAAPMVRIISLRVGLEGQR